MNIINKDKTVNIDDLFSCIDDQVTAFKKSIESGLILTMELRNMDMKFTKDDLKTTRKLLEINIRNENLISRSFKTHIIDLIIDRIINQNIKKQLENNRSK